MSNQGPNQTFNNRPGQPTIGTQPQDQSQTQSYQRYQSPNTWNIEASGPINVKDLDIIKDQLNHEAMAFKKWSVYTEYFQDQVLKDMATRTAQHHKQHFDTLQSYLNCQR